MYASKCMVITQAPGNLLANCGAHTLILNDHSGILREVATKAMDHTKR